MLAKNKFLLFYLIFIISIIGGHLCVASTGVFHADIKKIILTDIVVVIIASISFPIMMPIFQKDPASFVNRFLVVTTFQLFAILAYFGALAYTRVPFYRALIFHTLILFVGLMFIQSFLLVKHGVQKD